MQNLLSIPNLTALVMTHAGRVSEEQSYDTPHSMQLKAAVIAVVDALEVRAAGMPDIGAALMSVRKALGHASE